MPLRVHRKTSTSCRVKTLDDYSASSTHSICHEKYIWFHYVFACCIYNISDTCDIFTHIRRVGSLALEHWIIVPAQWSDAKGYVLKLAKTKQKQSSVTLEEKKINICNIVWFGRKDVYIFVIKIFAGHSDLKWFLSRAKTRLPQLQPSNINYVSRLFESLLLFITDIVQDFSWANSWYCTQIYVMVMRLPWPMKKWAKLQLNYTEKNPIFLR